MKNYTKILTLLLVVLMLVQATSFASFEYDVYAASGTGYSSAEDVVYKTSGKYIYNWGVREEEATFLTTYALSFYTGSNTYDVFSELDGGTSEKTASSSALYKALSSLMSSKQTYQTTYQGTRDLYQYTDCENGGGTISSFYSGDPIGPAWDSGSTWNREHCWPNSKGNASGNGENDIMMLRPTAKSENGSRGNKAYGESSGYYNPNTESNGAHDLRGDVARIVLYTYVRWNCTNTGSNYNPNGITGANGVIESIDILLTWIEEDPVDTWELGRNDSVQAITGTRNVFVDYPELAFLLFSEEIPEDMTTPSGEAKNGGSSSHTCVWDNGTVTVESTCTETGVMIYTCTDCGEIKTEVIEALGHSYDTSGCCTLCGQLNVNYRFIAAVDSLNGLSGKELYEGICDALRIYAELPDESKEDVADKYFDLKGFVAAYNGDVVVTNSYADLISTRAVGISVTVTTLSLALFCLFHKKHV